MSVTAVVLFLIGFGASWAAGRYLTKGGAVLQGAAIGICGVAALFVGMPGVGAETPTWGLVALIVYGLIGALIFRSAQGVREKGE